MRVQSRNSQGGVVDIALVRDEQSRILNRAVFLGVV
jgi:hypothetical protein